MTVPLHPVAEKIYEILDHHGFWDDLDEEMGYRPSRHAGRRSRSSTTKGMVRLTARRAYEPRKKKRRVSAYQREFGKQLKKLKKKHPRTSMTKLMKRAHAATKRARRGKR